MESEEIELWKEHPNQMFISTILRCLIACVVAPLLMLMSSIAFGEESWISILVIFAAAIAMMYYAVMSYIGAWNMLKFKNRSQWWISLMLLIGLIGAAILLCLKNKSNYASTKTIPNV
ncbi:hypothetical protein [Methanosarcina sp. UBA289]|uniref:hypothetical protein n=1 Tax=Methanosarcina sp. UBA289 TaxID=1915574 RepID=UPI0025EE02E4|nr:hypothetical protein [Methanosarcina sp. UBA289]